MDISVVVPLYNEEESLPELYAWIERVMKENNFSYEVIFVNDGSRDHSWDVICDLKSKNPEVKGIKFRRNYGKRRHKAMWSSRWTPTFRTLPTRFLSFIT